MNPTKMIVPAILAIGLTLYSFALFTGSAFLQNDTRSPAPAAQPATGLSTHFPNTIQQWKTAIEENAREYGLDPNLIAAVMLQESWRQRRGHIRERRNWPDASHAARWDCSQFHVRKQALLHQPAVNGRINGPVFQR